MRKIMSLTLFVAAVLLLAVLMSAIALADTSQQPPLTGSEDIAAALPVGGESASLGQRGSGQVIGQTWQESQHYGSMGRMVDWGWDATNGTFIHFSWTRRWDQFGSRHYYAYNYYAAASAAYFGQIPVHAPTGEYGAYVGIDVTNDNRAVIDGHLDQGSGNYAHVYWDFAPGIGFFGNGSAVPDQVVWPKFRYQEIPSHDPVTHVLAIEDHGSLPPLPWEALVYYRKVGTDANGTWDFPVIVDTVLVVGHDVACSNVDGKVALVWISPVTWATQPDMESDIHYQLSDNEGITWASPVNLTNNVLGQAGYRPYTDLSALITSDNELHIAWNGRVWPAGGNPTGYDALQCRMFHWSESIASIRTVASLEWNQTQCDGGAWQLNGSKMSLSECNGKLYYLWVQFNDIPNGINDDCAAYGGTGAANGELYLSVSADYGLTWDYARNLTNTYTPGCDPNSAYPCESEHWPSMARFGTDSPGDWSAADIVDPSGGSYAGDYYLDVQYIEDPDAGDFYEAEGTQQEADVKWFRLACVEPVPNPIIVPKPILFNVVLSHGVEEIVPLTIENIGNATLHYNISVVEFSGPPGWLGVSGYSGSIPAGIDNTEVINVILNQSGIINSPPDPVYCSGEIQITSDAPTSPTVIPVDIEVISDFCYANGDCNADGMVLTVGDLVYLTAFIYECGDTPDTLFNCDLNGDCVIDTMDVQVFQEYNVYGMSVFDPYGGYPVETCCDPRPEAVPDTALIFGIEHISLMTTCFDKSSGKLGLSRIASCDGDTLCIDSCFFPPVYAITLDNIPGAKGSVPRAESGGGPYGTSISNLEDAGVTWQIDPEDDDELGAGASLETDVYAVISGEPNEYLASVVQTKQEDDSWALAILSDATTYTVEAYLDTDLVWEGVIAATGEWKGAGTFAVPRAESGGGPYGTSISNLEDAGIVDIGWQADDTVTWNWGEQAVSDLSVSRLAISYAVTTPGSVSALSSVCLTAFNLTEMTIASESYGINMPNGYDDIILTSCGNAVLSVVDTTVVVSNIGSSGDDGIRCGKQSLNAVSDAWCDIAWVLENPDYDGTWPVGAGIKAGWAWPLPQDSSDWFISMTKAAPSTWNLGVESNYPLYTVEAYNNETSVFSAEGVAAADLGHIVETGKGIHPVGFQGGSTGKPAGIAATADYDFTAHPDGVQWSWAAQGVSGQTIDYLSVISDTTVAGNNPIDLLSASICADNGGAKDDPISFTILDIQVETGCCVDDRGNVDGDPGDQIDISDLVYLVDYMFTSGPPPTCWEEANVDGSGDGPPDGSEDIDISDLVYLVDYMFNGGPAPVACP